MSAVAEVMIIIAVFFAIGVGVGIAVVYGLSARRDSRSAGDDSTRPPDSGWTF